MKILLFILCGRRRAGWFRDSTSFYFWVKENRRSGTECRNWARTWTWVREGRNGSGGTPDLGKHALERYQTPTMHAFCFALLLLLSSLVSWCPFVAVLEGAPLRQVEWNGFKLVDNIMVWWQDFSKKNLLLLYLYLK